MRTGMVLWFQCWFELCVPNIQMLKDFIEEYNITYTINISLTNQLPYMA